ncbi:hypothetical protein PybrP1_003748 [[Pythium] brassicae (nom. inval.)]|nr:hypothetical protein PybrP1_003748 [[Pythium] brassicae (nom. inval.)]
MEILSGPRRGKWRRAPLFGCAGGIAERARRYTSRSP